jgi:hypothetical protein
VTVWSVEGQGSTFTLRLPDSAHAAVAADAATAPVEGDQPPPAEPVRPQQAHQPSETVSRGALP